MSEFTIPLTAIKGRGAASRLQHRFAAELRQAFDDGWSGGRGDGGADVDIGNYADTYAEADAVADLEVNARAVSDARANAQGDFSTRFPINTGRQLARVAQAGSPRSGALAGSSVLSESGIASELNVSSVSNAPYESSAQPTRPKPSEPPTPPAPATTVRLEVARSAITTNDSSDVYFDRSLNPYRGCEHGCIYCFARPTHSYLGLSPGLDFETQLIAKTNIAPLLRAELARASYRPAPLVLGTATDCYQPIERKLALTRAVIEVLSEARHPFAIVTKGSGLERDLDLLAPLAKRNLVAVYVTITSLDSALTRLLEPRAAAPAKRLVLIAKLAALGVPVGVSVAPQIPFLNTDMEQVLQAAAQAGASKAFYTVLRLPWELRPLFKEWLELHYPQRAARILARVQDLHGITPAQRAHGQTYAAHFGQRMQGADGPWANLLRQRFLQTCQRLGLNRERAQLDISQFRPPALNGQRGLFD